MEGPFVACVRVGGEEVRGCLSDLPLDVLRGCRPVRSPGVYQRQRHMPGHWFSTTAGGFLEYESLLERDWMLLMDFDRGVDWICEQPLRLLYVKDGRPASHVPDLLVWRGHLARHSHPPRPPSRPTRVLASHRRLPPPHQRGLRPPIPTTLRSRPRTPASSGLCQRKPHAGPDKQTNVPPGTTEIISSLCVRSLQPRLSSPQQSGSSPLAARATPLRRHPRTRARSICALLTFPGSPLPGDQPKRAPAPSAPSALYGKVRQRLDERQRRHRDRISNVREP